MGLFLTAGLGSGSTFQMIAVIFRKITICRVKLHGGTEEQAQREAVTDTAAALGFISAIGAVGASSSQSVWHIAGADRISGGAMKIFLVFYIVCVLVTWLVYGRKSQKNSHLLACAGNVIRSRSYVMSKLLDRFRYFKQKGDTFAEGMGK
jgi:NNP family nitrate/nitrite transporter-like MFS transporter